MKKLHLLCNAHLDPAWMWRWNEGLAEAISTFRIAADFCEKYDGFIFNHNEAVLYEWIMEHDPVLFKRIQKLVKEGKWHIMGGWYLQSDCLMPSGVSFMEQIKLGQEFFGKHFGVKPTTAINFDPFGHSRGLVQILKNAGYDSYIYCRPFDIRKEFLWEGYDGSQIIGHGTFWGYNSRLGLATQKIEECIKQELENSDTTLCLWGVGNHGGGASKGDLEDIIEYSKNSDVDIFHSYAENYIQTIDREKLPVFDKSLISCMVGCYTSMVRIKQQHRRLENKLALTQKALNYAAMSCGYEYDENELKKAKKALAFCQFHDILPGSGIKAVEEDSLRTLGYGQEICDKMLMGAFIKLSDGHKKAADKDIPIMAFNPHPFPVEQEFEFAYFQQQPNWDDTKVTLGTVCDEDGNILPTQTERCDGNINIDDIVKVSFKAKLAPSSVTRFDMKLKKVDVNSISEPKVNGEFITVENSRMKAQISTKTGLIHLYELDEKTYISKSGKLEMYKDNEDPWGQNVKSFKDLDGEFKLMSDDDVAEFLGYSGEVYPNVRIVEDGDVRTKVQAFFEYKKNTAVVEYTIPKNSTYIDVNIFMYSNEPNKMIKYHIDTAICGEPWGDMAFGAEKLYDDERESVYQKWCGIKEETGGLYVLNKGIYGGSFTNSSIKLSLLRTPIYSCLPIQERQLAPHNRFLNHIDMGERRFEFRITADGDIAQKANVYNEAPELLPVFPSGDGTIRGTSVEIDNPDIILATIYKQGDKYQLVVHNTSDKPNDAKINLPYLKKQLDVHFEKYQVKTIEV